MERKMSYVLVSCVFTILLNAIMSLSHPAMPPTTTEISSPLSYITNIIGAQKGHQANEIFGLKKYLSSIGYMRKIDVIPNNPVNTNLTLFDDNLEFALKTYQGFFKLNVSGVLDSQTVLQLQRPRCGVPDTFSNDETSIMNSTGLKDGSLFTVFQGSPKWWTKSLTYSFAPGTRGDVMKPISNALSQWSWAALGQFKFTYTPNYDQANIKISFQVWNHGDGANFDGPRGILAHAFAPNDGRLHYDGSEDWVDGVVANKFDLQSIGLHELGHVLGLGHSTDQSAIMFAYMSSGIRKGLSRDDIVGIRSLYNIQQ